jgi:hypothetical protein
MLITTLLLPLGHIPFTRGTCSPRTEFDVRLDEPFEGARAFVSRATSLHLAIFQHRAKPWLGSTFTEPDRVEPRAGSAWLDSTPKGTPSVLKYKMF